MKGVSMARRNWLQAQIREADSDVQRWPEWMKKVAIFDGRRRDDAIDPSTASEPKTHEQSGPAEGPKRRDP
jgi:hypothetical protein